MSVPIYLLFVSVILGLAIGITILLAQFFGAKQFEQIKSLISTMSIFLFVLGLVMALGGAILSKSLLQITQTPAELLELASVYLRMVFLGIPFSILYNLLGAVMKSFGETKMPLYALIASSIINLVLNIIFVRNGGGCYWNCCINNYCTGNFWCVSVDTAPKEISDGNSKENRVCF